MDSIHSQYSNSTSYHIKSIEPTSSINTLSGTDFKRSISNFIESNKYLKLLHDDLILGNHCAEYALKRAHLVYFNLGPELSHEYLFPFLIDIQKSLDNSLLLLFCDTWYLLYKSIDLNQSLSLVFKGLEYLLTLEGPLIREKAIDTILLIVDDISKKNPNGRSSPVEIVTTLINPMIATLVESDWFPGATSCCYLIPKIYKYASEKSQNELRQMFQNLCDSDILTVKIAAARNLKELIALVQHEHAISMFWLVLKNMSIDNEEVIRIHAVETCLVFAKQCTSEQNLNFNIPILKSASEDTSWKVRQYISKNFLTIYETFEESDVKENLFDNHLSLLNDENINVKLTANQSFSNWSGILSQELIEQYVPVLETLAKKSSKEIRKSVCKTLGMFAMKLKKKDVMAILRPTLQQLLCDEFVEVRLCVLENIHLICDREEFYGIIGDKLIETIDLSIANQVWRNRLVIAEQLTSFFSHFGTTIFEQNILSALFRLLLDDVWKVRNAVLISLEKICNECGSIWAVKFILSELTVIYLTPRQSKYAKNTRLTMSIKIVILQSLVAVSKSIDVENAIEHIVPLLLKSLTDSIPNIRFVAVNSLANLFIIYKNENPELFLQAKCALIKLCQDSDIDVKYFSRKALDTYEECFRNSLII